MAQHKTIMKSAWTITLAMAGALAACSQQPETASQAPAPETFADLIIVNADIHTVDPDQPRANALAVKNGAFAAVGDDGFVGEMTGPDTTVVDAGGATIIPGLIDGHVHLTSGINLVCGVNLYGIADRAEWLRMIAERDRELPEGAWILGGRWDHTLADDPLPTKEELDAVAPDRPILLSDVDGHSTWANSRALELAGIDAATASPSNGVIVKDPDTGEPTGILKEGASSLVYNSAAYQEGTAMNPEERLEALADTLRFANSLGLTGAHEMAGLATFDNYVALAESRRLPMRIWYGFYPNEEELAGLSEIGASRQDYADQGPRLSLGYIKYSIDGVLSTHTAALFEPYADKPDDTGLPMMGQDAINERVAKANAAGFPVAIHAIGDRGVRMALDAFAASPDKPALPNRVEHIEMIKAEDMARFRNENVIASMNPHHAVTTFHNYLTERIGEEREETAYAWNAIAEAGASLVFGSDWATAPLSPFEQLWSATFRISALGENPAPWKPENAVSFDAALHAYTQAAADASGWGGQIGSITPGKWADFVILDATLGEPVTQDLKSVKVRATYLAGEPVYQME